MTNDSELFWTIDLMIIFSHRQSSSSQVAFQVTFEHIAYALLTRVPLGHCADQIDS